MNYNEDEFKEKLSILLNNIEESKNKISSLDKEDGNCSAYYIKDEIFRKTENIICLDIGDGECSAYYMTRDKDNKIKLNRRACKLYLKDEYENRIASVMCFLPDGKITIGQMATVDGAINVANFKKSPPNNHIKGWDEVRTVSDGEKTQKITYKELMKIFITQLWKNITYYNSVDDGCLHDVRTEGITLFVGCPSSDNWLKPWTDKTGNVHSPIEEYTQLIKDATGLGNVFVIPESTAAAFRSITDNKTVRYSDGVLVFDFGSSTADFTYMYGDYRKELSWSLGAGEIERIMYYFMYGRGNRSSERFTRNIERHCFEIRMLAKEKYFLPSDANNKTKDILFRLGKTDNLFNVNDDFMNMVLHAPLLNDVIENGNPIPLEYTQIPTGMGWYEHCEKFFIRCKNLLGADRMQYPINRIVLTGGASTMYFIEELCRKVFANEADVIIEKDSNSSACVGFGLCLMAQNVFRLPELIKREIELFNDSDASDLVYILARTKRKIMSYFFSNFKKFAITLNDGKYPFGELILAMADYMSKNIHPQVIENLVRTDSEDIQEIFNSLYNEISRDCSMELYGYENFNTDVVYDHNIGCFEENSFEKSCFTKKIGLEDFLTGAKKIVSFFQDDMKYEVNIKWMLKKGEDIFSTMADDFMLYMHIPMLPLYYNKMKGLLTYFQNEKLYNNIFINDIKEIVTRTSLLSGIINYQPDTDTPIDYESEYSSYDYTDFILTTWW